ncbi:hypothetical protein ROZALSC1DRAFT_22313 [Rozella allomycis CSF55]|uniref:Uncharacterized protein n=1 Tax=Rozella allomycis (strain CSF55) TaxID=988480 RepID=A0A4P9YIK4_ROZAC|nr:hypothetical protein ROZALSC1DRAFT_22313 [Rozella allomycis CSF55]
MRLPHNAWERVCQVCIRSPLERCDILLKLFESKLIILGKLTAQLKDGLAAAIADKSRLVFGLARTSARLDYRTLKFYLGSAKLRLKPRLSRLGACGLTLIIRLGPARLEVRRAEAKPTKVWILHSFSDCMPFKQNPLKMKPELTEMNSELHADFERYYVIVSVSRLDSA